MDKYKVELSIVVEYDVDNSGRTTEQVAEQILENICWSYRPATGEIVKITNLGETND
jgi:hypothetical protein